MDVGWVTSANQSMTSVLMSVLQSLLHNVDKMRWCVTMEGIPWDAGWVTTVCQREQNVQWPAILQSTQNAIQNSIKSVTVEWTSMDVGWVTSANQSMTSVLMSVLQSLFHNVDKMRW